MLFATKTLHISIAQDWNRFRVDCLFSWQYNSLPLHTQSVTARSKHTTSPTLQHSSSCGYSFYVKTAHQHSKDEAEEKGQKEKKLRVCVCVRESVGERMLFILLRVAGQVTVVFKAQGSTGHRAVMEQVEGVGEHKSSQGEVGMVFKQVSQKHPLVEEEFQLFPTWEQ